jgi:hypothetical protein
LSRTNRRTNTAKGERNEFLEIKLKLESETLHFFKFLNSKVFKFSNKLLPLLQDLLVCGFLPTTRWSFEPGAIVMDDSWMVQFDEKIQQATHFLFCRFAEKIKDKMFVHNTKQHE